MNKKVQSLTLRLLSLVPCQLFLAGVASAQTIVHSFDGDSGPGLAMCESGVAHCDRPEMDVATNGKQVVQVTWQNVRIYNTSGRLLRSTPMTAFIRKAGLNPVSANTRIPNSPATSGPYEPHIVYNEFINRWIVTVTGQNDSMLVSASPDAMGSWGGVYPSCLQGGPCLSQDPSIHVGYDKNGVYLCEAHLGDDNLHTVPKVAYDCFAIPSAEIRAVAQGIAPQHINRVHNMPLDVYPAIDHNRSKHADSPAFFASKSCDRATPGGCQNAKNFPFHWVVDTFTWNRATGTYNANGEQEIKTGVGSTEDKWFYSKPCCGQTGSIPQTGNDTIALRVTESHRLNNLVQFGSHLQVVLTSGPCTSGCGSQGTDANNVMFWADLDCSKATACVVSQTAKISGTSFIPEFATVGVDAVGNIGIVAVSSTASTDLSVLLWTHRKADPPNSFKGPTMIVSGTQPYTCLNTKNMVTIGNAVGVLTALDPLDGASLWTTQQWSNDATPCVWDTRIVQYQIDAAQASSAKHHH